MAIPTTSEAVSRLAEGEPFSFSFHYFSENVIKYINSLLAKTLSQSDQIYLLDMVITIVREICINAIKANAKRVYFQISGLDINDANSYASGIKLFKKNIVGNFDAIRSNLETSKLSVVFTLRQNNDGLTMQIMNNTPIHPDEMIRINLRMEKAKYFNDFTEAYEEIYDDTEGAGLGIVLTTLLLKNSGIGYENYSIRSEGKNTVATFKLPRRIKPESIVTKIKTRILNDLDGLPAFPEHITKLIVLCGNPEASISEISEKVMTDPALSTDVLKLSNSAGFVPTKRIETIPDAVKIIGLKNLNSMLIATGARRILDSRYSKFEEIWAHCNRVAFYARRIASTFKLGGGITENAYLAGLLHDLGKIVMLSTDKQLTNKIADITKDRKIRTSTVLEEISIGISHATLGGLMSQKWELPEYITQAIQHHHTPLSADNDHRDIVAVVYFANYFCGIETRRYQMCYMEDDVLERFQIQDEDAFNKLHLELKKSYELQSQHM